jgi:phosphoserine aminotransferase
MLKYTTHSEKKSMFNTPPTFAIYIVDLFMKWLEESVGGIERMEVLNRMKANLLYDYMDSQDFYRGTARPDSRSRMNITFRLPNEDLEGRFIKEAIENGMGGLKGHRSVGGCRASLYNAVSLESVEALVEFMKEFVKKNG